MNRMKIKSPANVLFHFRTHFAPVWIIYNAKQCPEWCARFAADEPGGCHATQFRDACLESCQTQLFVWIV